MLRINFLFLVKTEAVDKMKNADLGEKKWTVMIIKKLFIIVISIIQRRLTEQQRYRERNTEKSLEKGRRYHEENKERLQK